MELLTQEKRGWLASKGIVFDSAVTHLLEDVDYAQDAQATLITTANSGIPAFLTNYMDPNIIRVLVSPMKAEEIFPPVMKGDWTTKTAMFRMIESTGEVSSYGDYNNNGAAGFNTKFPQRQSYLYQTVTTWGDLELAEAELAQIAVATEKNVASALILRKYQNKTYFNGVAGLENYGILNQPDLSATIAPGPKAFNTNVSGPWQTNGLITATANEIFLDIQAMFRRLVTQTNGIVEKDTPMKLCLSPTSDVALTATNNYNVSVSDLLQKSFPNIRTVTAPEYTTTAGELVQLIVDSIDGQEVGNCAFNASMRAFPIFRDLSSYRQKKMQGTYGAIIHMPMAVSQMLGV